MKTIIITAIIALIALTGLIYVEQNLFKKDIYVKVTNKEKILVINKSNSYYFYLIYSGNDAFKIEDDILRMQFNSFEMYNKIEIDSTYNFTTVGSRNYIFNTYPTIIKINN